MKKSCITISIVCMFLLLAACGSSDLHGRIEETLPVSVPPRPVEEGKLVYLKLSELHPFHTFRPHPFKVRDDAKMQETVASIKLNGVTSSLFIKTGKTGKLPSRIIEA